MKLKTTNKAIKNGYNKIIGVGYCDLQSLLTFKSPFAYTSGTYGWNCDFYDVDGVCICTGYRSIVSKNSSVDYDVMREYERKASVIRCDNTIDYETKKEMVNALLLEFVNECTK